MEVVLSVNERCNPVISPLNLFFLLNKSMKEEHHRSINISIDLTQGKHHKVLFELAKTRLYGLSSRLFVTYIRKYDFFKTFFSKYLI